MNIPPGIIFGIIAMLCWGTADFFVANAVRKTSSFKTFVWSQIIGLILFFIIFSLFFNIQIPSLSLVILILASGLLGAVSYLAFYKGLQIGKVSIISPVSACWPVIAIILSLIFLSEKLTGIQSIGISLAIIGAILTSFKFNDLLKLKNVATGIKYGVVALIGWGIYFTFIDILVSELSWFLPMFFIKIATVLCLLTNSTIMKKEISFPKNVALFIILIGILEAVAYLFYGIGITSEYTAIVAPIVATFPMVTIILARVFFKEKLELNQKLGVAFVLVSLVILSL
ncbi:MAG: DMT family transporter [Candidatus Nanoarchaeia archaeon]|nr:DMT family transporter [Candidatus Nanoarchaeia archaeon]